jgi:hypothetical protein
MAIQMGKQAWLGIAASLGYTAMATIWNPWNLLGRLEDLAQDIEYIQLSDEVWKVLETNANALCTGVELSERLHKFTCKYYGIANLAGSPSCLACGSPLGQVQPR